MASSSVPMNNVLFFALLFTTLVVAHEEKSSNYFLTDEDFERARSTDFSSAPFNSSKMENPDLFEGDIMDPYVSLKGASLSERENMYKMMDAKFFGNALRDPNALWPKGVVPYIIHGSFDSRERAAIAKAMQEYRDKTCIRWVKRTRENDYVVIVRANGCFSYIGRIGGEQQLSLGYGCGYVGVAEHEMMHAIGFHHEQNRADRDDYVRVLLQNVDPPMQFNFKKETLETITHLGTRYDYGSIMHYENTAFSINGQPTIIALDDRNRKLGQRDGFSSNDVYKINRLYNCQNKPEPGNRCRDLSSSCSKYIRRNGCNSRATERCPASCGGCK